MTTALDLAPITLAELTDRAALMTRADSKYLVPVTTARRLLDDLGDSLRVLEIGGRRALRYRSTYYDTPALTAYRGAATGRRRRFKVRRRDYVDTGTSFLEVKTRTGRGHSHKQRMPLPDLARPSAAELDTAALQLGPDQRRFVLDALQEAGCPPPREVLEPILSTRYDRTTLLLEGEGSRITMDAELTWADPRTGQHGPALSDLLVVETKSAAGAGTVDRLLWAQGHRPVRLSKYATGLALLRSDLPANRWHRTLTQVRLAS